MLTPRLQLVHIPFLRVSTRQQDTDRQLTDIRARAHREGWELAEPIIEVVSGAKRNAERPGLQRLLATARRRDTIVVTEISRLGRRTSEVLSVLEELNRRGVSVLALNLNIHTLYSDGTPNPYAQFLATLLAEFARMERETLRERVQSGVENARAKGKTLGRPVGKTKPSEKLLEDYPVAAKLLQAGLSAREVAVTTKLARNTVLKVRAKLVQDGKLSPKGPRSSPPPASE